MLILARMRAIPSPCGGACPHERQQQAQCPSGASLVTMQPITGPSACDRLTRRGVMKKCTLCLVSPRATICELTPSWLVKHLLPWMCAAQ
jgi:hypothetical protein